jgi:GNAT superfamily N-acetyltransferase
MISIPLLPPGRAGPAAERQMITPQIPPILSQIGGPADALAGNRARDQAFALAENLWPGPARLGFPGRVRIERFDPVTDTVSIRSCYELHVACQPVDDPDVPAASLPVFTGWVSRGWDADPREGWLATGDEPGSWAGGYLLRLPARENRHMARLGLMVAPAYRRRGIGTALLRHAAGRADANGRARLTTGTKENSAGAAFAAAAGAEPGVTEVRRVLDLAAQPAGYLDPLRSQAGQASHGYSLVTWFGKCPEEYLDQVAAIINAMADAPHDPDEEPEVLDGQRLRDSEDLDVIQQTRGYSVAARCDRTGELVAMTRIVVDPLQPDWGWQELTAVVRAHRGHRLGLLVKVAMMDWLAEAEPAVQHILTGNSASNSHMITINADLGYRVLDRWPSWELDVPRMTAGAALHSQRPAELR